MSNQSKRKRTDFTPSQRWNRMSYLQRMAFRSAERLKEFLFQDIVSEMIANSGTEPPGSEDMPRKISQ